MRPDIQNEFIELCGKRVQKTILKEREDAIYYGIICDATPDVSHTEQNVVLIRYVPYNKNVDDWEITERFLEFKDFYKKTGSEIAGMIERVLMDRGIDISDCRGQGYDVLVCLVQNGCGRGSTSYSFIGPKIASGAPGGRNMSYFTN